MSAASFDDLPKSRCRSCGSKVRWVETEAGKKMPIDPQPHHAGNVVRLADGRARVMTDPPLDLPAYRSHFVTCPNAAQHRRAR